MPLVRMQTFSQRHSGVTGKPGVFFRWENYPAEDAAFIEYINSGPASNATLDRSSSTNPPTLEWEDGDEVVHTQSVGEPGTHWDNNVYDPSTGTQEPAPFDVSGYWNCDVYGRPFNLNDLLA